MGWLIVHKDSFRVPMDFRSNQLRLSTLPHQLQVSNCPLAALESLSWLAMQVGKSIASHNRGWKKYYISFC